MMKELIWRSLSLKIRWKDESSKDGWRDSLIAGENPSNNCFLVQSFSGTVQKSYDWKEIKQDPAFQKTCEINAI